MKKARVYISDIQVGELIEDEDGYHFLYLKEYLNSLNPKPVSLTLPVSSEIYNSNVLFPFFDGLIPEGWLLNIAKKSWKLDLRDRMSLLLATCEDCIGYVSIKE